MLALIDADVITHRTAWRYENNDPQGNKQAALADAESTVEMVVNSSGADDFLLFFTKTRKTFRNKILPSYKAGRHKHPVLHTAIKSWIKKKYPKQIREVGGLEADDLIGIEATAKANYYKSVIISSDKDFKQIPCYYYNPFFEQVVPVKIKEDDADYFFHYQWLMGDRVDGYTGIPGTGKAKAKAFLDDVPKKQRTVAVFQKYIDSGFSLKDALVQARCARILRAGEYSTIKKKVNLWCPSGYENELAGWFKRNGGKL